MAGIDVLPIIEAGLALLALGAAIIGLLSLVPKTAQHARGVWPIYLTEVGIVGTVFAAFAAGGTVLRLAVLALVFRVSYEAALVALSRQGQHAGTVPQSLAAGALAALLGFGAGFLPLATVVLAATAAASMAVLTLFSRRSQSASDVYATLEIALFPLLPAIVFAAAAARAEWAGLLVLLFALVETNDSYALLGGKVFGRRQAFPNLSPKKTVEGLAIGAAALALTAALVGRLVFGFPSMACIAVALATGVLATAGDLAASRLKRRSGVKDFPQLVPRQGGLLDIVDAWLLTGAVIVAVAVLAG